MNFSVQLQRKKKYVFFGIAIGLISLILMSIITKIWVYFHTKSEALSAFHQDVAVQHTHSPKLIWTNTKQTEGREMEGFTKEKISKDYISAWFEWNLYLKTGDNSRLADFFHKKLLHKSPKFHVTPPFQLQNDLMHHLDLYIYSQDGQTVAFTDTKAELVHQGFASMADTAAPVYTQFHYQKVEVVMILLEGNWKILNWRFSPISEKKETKPIPADCEFMRIKGQELYENGTVFRIKGMNYYPQAHPWDMWGKNFDIRTIQRDFHLMDSLGFNTIRIFLPFEDLGSEKVKPEILQQIEALLDAANAANLKVIPTLFDFSSDYRIERWAATDRHLETILSTFKEREEILAYDLKNEPDLDFRYQSPKLVQDWLDFTLQKAKIYDPNHLFTIGWSDAKHAAILSDKLDFISFHFYKKIEQLAPDIDSLQKQVGTKLVVLEEFGLSTFRAYWYLGKTESEQAQYYEQLFAILRKKKNMPFMAWTLYDFSNIPSKVAGNTPQNKYPQKSYGIFNEFSRPKLVHQTIQKYIVP